jgi:sulfur carrier protein
VRISLNGAERDLPDGATVAAAARLVGVDPDERGVAVAVEGAVVPKARWAETPIPEGARVEVVRATAGG